MKTYMYKFGDTPLGGSDVLAEASTEELRVLVCLLEAEGRITLPELAKRAAVKQARAAAAVSLFEASGVLTLSPDGVGEVGRVVDEFDFRLQPDTLEEERSTDTARTIRDEHLHGMLEECARLLGRPTLNEQEIRTLVALYSQYNLSDEFIVTLLSDLSSRSKTSVRALANRAIRLSGDGIDTVEALNAFFREREEKGEWERRARKVLGVYSRALSTEEKTLFRKWVELYGYGEPILTLAYDKTVHNTQGFSVAYMDKILTDWNEHGCRTPAACEEHYQSSRPKTPAKGSKGAAEAPKQRYGNFDPAEAFRRALERSYETDVDVSTKTK